MKTTEELLLAAKVREIALEHGQQFLGDGKRKFKNENPEHTDEQWVAEVKRLQNEHYWEKYVPDALKVLERTAEVIEQQRAAR